VSSQGGRPPKVTPEVLAEIERLAREGHAPEAIASMLGLSSRTVHRHLPDELRAAVKLASSARQPSVSSRLFGETIKAMLEAYQLEASEVDAAMITPDGPPGLTVGRLLSGSREPSFSRVARLLYGVRSAQIERRLEMNDAGSLIHQGSDRNRSHDFLVAARTPATLAASAELAGQLLQYLCRPAATGTRDADYTRTSLEQPITWSIRTLLDFALRQRDAVVSTDERKRLLSNLLATLHAESNPTRSSRYGWFLTNVLHLVPRAALHTPAEQQLEVEQTFRGWFESPEMDLNDPRAARAWHVGWINWWMSSMGDAAAEPPPADLAITIPEAFLEYLRTMDAAGPEAGDAWVQRGHALRAMEANLDYLDLVCGADDPIDEARYRAALRFLVRSSSRDELVAAIDIRTIYWAVQLVPRLLSLPRARSEIKEVVLLDRTWEYPRLALLPADAQEQLGAIIQEIEASTAPYVKELAELLLTDKS
jgi:hypothetical protein